jgi:toxin ParE1/3/4
MKVRFSRRALIQIKEISNYIAADNPRTAENVEHRLETLAAQLGRYPAMGRRTSLANVRVFSVRPYPFLMFYQTDVDKGEVTILRIRHMARKEDWRSGR